ncbi:uncharacterized protein UTRI_06153 [Ustilago trichophora]|uniref:Uncharacterized protein n=1 Tax=Ustilago trichophora TaxID=86804 RepID=A0A5C3EEW8_9BASI|nr:uncharacterized protein UTRI_06153 [Ustilago trichophora]
MSLHAHDYEAAHERRTKSTNMYCTYSTVDRMFVQASRMTFAPLTRKKRKSTRDDRRRSLGYKSMQIVCRTRASSCRGQSFRFPSSVTRPVASLISAAALETLCMFERSHAESQVAFQGDSKRLPEKSATQPTPPFNSLSATDALPSCHAISV